LVDAELAFRCLHRYQIAIDIGEGRCGAFGIELDAFAKNNVGGPAGTAIGLGKRSPNDEIIKSIAIDISCTAHRNS